MGITLNIVEGKLTVVVEGVRGEADYFLEELPGPPWQLRLTRIDEPDRTYTVERLPRGWRCTCKDWQYRPARRISGCKHSRCAHHIFNLLRALREGEAPESLGK